MKALREVKMYHNRLEGIGGAGCEAGRGVCRREVSSDCRGRSLWCYWAVRELGVSMSSLARKLGISIPSVGESVSRGRRIAEGKKFFLL